MNSFSPTTSAFQWEGLELQAVGDLHTGLKRMSKIVLRFYFNPYGCQQAVPGPEIQLSGNGMYYEYIMILP